MDNVKTLEEIEMLISMGEDHLITANAYEKLQVEKCLTSLRTLKQTMLDKDNKDVQ